MSSSTYPPFSARSKGRHRQIDGDFPSTARSGLLHLIFDLVEKQYVADWGAVARELHRIGRLPPTEYDMTSNSSIRQAKEDTSHALNELKWDRVYDFCERLYSHLAYETLQEYPFGNFQVVASRSDVQQYISSELQRLFIEEELAYEFSNGTVKRRCRKHNAELNTKAQVVMGDPRLTNARTHYEKALRFFRHPSKPDYENAVKEAVCAVESVGKTLFPVSKSSTLGDVAKWLALNKDLSVPKAICQTITGVYGFRSGGDGIAHGGAAGGVATLEVTEYVLAVCASQIIYFVDIANTQEVDIPF